MNNTNCKQLLNQINVSGFALDDILLYLDTHPTDKEALNYYQQCVGRHREAMAAYESQCGPLLMDQVAANNNWTWLEGPWPWEGDMC